MSYETLLNTVDDILRGAGRSFCGGREHGTRRDPDVGPHSRAAIGERDGSFADFSQAPPDQHPDPKYVIR